MWVHTISFLTVRASRWTLADPLMRPNSGSIRCASQLCAALLGLQPCCLQQLPKRTQGESCCRGACETRIVIALPYPNATQRGRRARTEERPGEDAEAV